MPVSIADHTCSRDQEPPAPSPNPPDTAIAFSSLGPLFVSSISGGDGERKKALGVISELWPNFGVLDDPTTTVIGQDMDT